MLRRFGLVTFTVAAIELALFSLAMPKLNQQKSPRPIAEAATRHSQIRDEIGVLGLRPLEGGIAYYGDRRVLSLRDESALRTFLDDGGQFVILRDRQLKSLKKDFEIEAIERFRRGRRRLALARRVESQSLQLDH
ncbi:MAG: hypothetical protein VCB25_08355 [Myxococcota bacterium]